MRRLGPAKLILLDRDESGLHGAQLLLYGSGLLDTDDMVLCDIRDHANTMKVLITGGAGFIGQSLARHLTDGGHEVVALDRLVGQVHLDPVASVERFPGHVLQEEVTDEAAWALLDRPDTVVHLAAETGTGQSMYEAERYRHLNVVGTRVTGQAAQSWGVPLVALSSRAIYGNGATSCREHGDQFGAPCCDAAIPKLSLIHI